MERFGQMENLIRLTILELKLAYVLGLKERLKTELKLEQTNLV